YDDWVIDVGRRELCHRAGQTIPQTTMEFDLLLTLARNATRVLSCDQLLDALKGVDWSPLDRGVDALVSCLRRKIESDAEAPQLIKTVRGVGMFLPCRSDTSKP
ncbi:MAG: winged helix family transcriptional regulator, partial [Alphaproteobacteria bacterium]|nr:winged helix family transcriptional regulator [Alphaproteobacteria bacterium]